MITEETIVFQIKDSNPFHRVSKRQVLEDLDASDEDLSDGKVKDAHEAMNDIRLKLGMPV